MLAQCEADLVHLRKQTPLILNLTNVVTMDFMANAQLALGASPLMSVADEELDELISISQALHINLGTLDTAFIKRCHAAVQFAKKYQKPIVLDPVGAGASKLRTNTALALLPYCTVVRGNASEILSLANLAHATKGVDSTHHTNDAIEAATQLAKKNRNTVIISGEIDYVTNGTDAMSLPYGSPLMPLVVGMGCTLTAVIAAFVATQANVFQSAVSATLYFGLCGTHTATQCQAPGSFRTHFIDNLYQADFNTLRGYHAE